MDYSFYNGRKVLITGHTGFKGSWMCQFLLQQEANIIGYALKPPTEPSMFDILRLESKITHIVGDVRDFAHLMDVFRMYQPEVVIHMAAQPLVRESYKDPVGTYETNVMGTVHICECIRQNPCVKSFVNVTTDKVYKNREWEWGYRENEELNGFDPYSNSKSCSELVTGSYVESFFSHMPVAVSTVRAGNVIGGGDFAVDRILPDCIRAAAAKKNIIVRNPYSTRPYEHVLEPVAVYLMIAMKQYEDSVYAGSYNVGPNEEDCWTTGDLVTLFCRKWNALTSDSIQWIDQSDKGPHEAGFLKLDCSRLKRKFGWKPRWSVEDAMEKIVEWFGAYQCGDDLLAITDRQIQEYLK